MRLMHDAGALHGYDGRVIYSDSPTVALYGLMREDIRREVRDMMRTDWSVHRDLTPDDLTDADGIVSAVFRVSDCVARCRIEIGASLPAYERVILENNEIRTGQDIPDTVLSSISRMDACEVFGHPVLRGVRLSGIRQERPLVLVWSGLSRYIVDGDPATAEPQLACGALA